MVVPLAAGCIVSRHAEEAGRRTGAAVDEAEVQGIGLAAVGGSANLVHCLVKASSAETPPLAGELATHLGPVAVDTRPYADAIRLVLFLTGLGAST